eukprot:12430735-Karenia_brevis.AAC.1
MEVSNVEAFVAEGYRVGGVIYLKKRITIKCGKSDKDRKDMLVGQKAHIKGFIDNDYIVCLFDVGGKNTTVEWKVNKAICGLENPDDAKESDKKASGSKKYEFLGDMSKVDVCDDWPQTQMVREDGRESTLVRNSVAFVLDQLVEQLPQYDATDFLIVKRGNEWEVWTLKDFKPGTIKFAPESTEIKPRYWTANRACLVENTYVAPADGGLARPMVLDGRVRASPDSKSAFALFWLVQRQPAKDDQSPVNMELTYVTASLSVDLNIRGKSNKVTYDESTCPSIPVMTNPSKIKKHTRLVIKEDVKLAKLAEKLEAEKGKDKDKKDKDKKDKSKASSSGAADADEPKTKKAKHH